MEPLGSVPDHQNQGAMSISCCFAIPCAQATVVLGTGFWPRALPARVLSADQAVGLELAVQRRRADPQLRGGVGLVSTVQLQRGEDVLLLDLIQRPHRSVGGTRPGKRLADLLGWVLELHAASARERDSALHGVLKLAHVSRPLVAQELVCRPRGKARDLPLHPQRRLPEQYPGERQNVVSALAQGWHA